ncbi:pilus assembly protein [Moritella sp. 5]|uniref:TadE/TadG family type IV pilus assembly protein n=1 Tax=Moritella sp. 5 TaxID=2746231 RepID=UPI001BAB0D41|nr:TadE family protein [Moritella sp. 5]QUM81962.1 pilus assembly protein [Moritella sp. 5]
MYKSSRPQRGVASIEFALGLFPFWLLVCVWVEMSYVSYIAGLTDLALAESARAVKKENVRYVDAFKKNIKSNSTLWSKFLDINNFKMSVHYLADIQALMNVTSVCQPDESEFKECGTAYNSAIAIYRVEYKYKPIFNYFFSDDQVLVRELIAIQENERSEFQV